MVCDYCGASTCYLCATNCGGLNLCRGCRRSATDVCNECGGRFVYDFLEWNTVNYTYTCGDCDAL